MRRKLIPSLMKANTQPELRNQEVIEYKVWTNTSLGNWSDTGNWRGGIKPTGGDNVLFGPYQGTCVINENTNHINCFRVRNDYTANITCDRIITLSGYFTYYGDGTFSTNRSTINATSGDVRLDGDGRVFWDRSIWNLSGGFIQRSLDTPVDNFSTINMLGSGKTISSEDELYRVGIKNATTINDNLTVKGPLHVSGNLTISSGVSLISEGLNARVSVYSVGRTLGQGSLVLQEDATLNRNDGYIGNDYLIIKNNDIGEVLPAAIYSTKNLIVKNDQGDYNTFIFGTGIYHFDSDVSFQSSGGGVLEINNRFNAAEVHFNRGLFISSGDFSEVIWTTGNGSIVLGKPTSLSKEFTRSLCERGGINVADNPRGLAMSYKNQINGEPILWVLDSGDINYAGSGIGVRAVTLAGHTVGTFLHVTSTPATGLGDLRASRLNWLSATSEFLLMGDIADPDANRPIIRIAYSEEPTVTGFNFFSDAGGGRLVYQYPASPVGESGGTPRDARAFAFDYSGSDLYIVTHKTNPPQLFFLSGALVFGTRTLQYSGNLQIESGVLSMDIARNGKSILVQTKEKLYHYSVTGNSTICQTLTGTVPQEIYDYIPGYNEEGMCWGSGNYLNDSIYTIETWNPNVGHTHDLRSPMWLYRKRSEIDTRGLRLDRLYVEASGHEKVLNSHLYVNDISVMSGILNLSGSNITAPTGFYVGPKGNFSRRGFKSGATITTSGDFVAVGSLTNLLNMHPDSGNGGWVLHVGGAGRTYYAQVRASNAASGSTIYSYLGSNYGANTNWNFDGSGGAPVSGHYIDLYISGAYSGIGQGNFIPLFIVGKSGDASGLIDLYISGGTPGSVYNYIDLYVTGGIRGDLTGSIPLYLTNSGVDGSIPLFIRGLGDTTGAVPLYSVLYLTLANSGVGSGVDLITVGGGSLTGGFPIVLVGSSGISGGIPLYLASYSSVGGPNAPQLKIYTHGKHANQ